MKKPTLAQREEKAREEVVRAAMRWHGAANCITAIQRSDALDHACARLAAVLKEKKRAR